MVRGKAIFDNSKPLLSYLEGSEIESPKNGEDSAERPGEGGPTHSLDDAQGELFVKKECSARHAELAHLAVLFDKLRSSRFALAIREALERAKRKSHIDTSIWNYIRKRALCFYRFEHVCGPAIPRL